MTTCEQPDPSWESALERLQDDLTAAELAHLRGEPFDLTGWAPPALATPLPSYLLERARDLHARQEALTDLLATVRDRARRQLDVTRRINQATGAASRPATVFFDATA